MRYRGRVYVVGIYEKNYETYHEHATDSFIVAVFYYLITGLGKHKTFSTRDY